MPEIDIILNAAFLILGYQHGYGIGCFLEAATIPGAACSMISSSMACL